MLLAFEVVGTVEQQVRIIKKGYSEDMIITALEEGTLCTTTWFGKYDSQITDRDGAVVAVVESQEIDGEYTDYR